MKRWNVFISHASEDKEAVALPLSKGLQDVGVSVWLDSQELKIGDSLREKIDEGLAESEFGIVIISPAFLAKEWPKKELNGLFALEEEGHKVILPVWYNVNKKQIAGYSPILADRLACNWENGVERVVKEIISVIFSDETRPTLRPTVRRALIELLATGPTIEQLRAFLAAHDYITAEALECHGNTTFYGRTQLESWVPDVDGLTIYSHSSTRQLRWRALFCGSITESPFGSDGKPTAALEYQCQRILEFSQWAVKRADINTLTCTLLYGRRKMWINQTRDLLRTFRPSGLDFTITNHEYYGQGTYEQEIDFFIRSYDWLIELA